MSLREPKLPAGPLATLSRTTFNRNTHRETIIRLGEHTDHTTQRDNPTAAAPSLGRASRTFSVGISYPISMLYNSGT